MHGSVTKKEVIEVAVWVGEGKRWVPPTNGNMTDILMNVAIFIGEMVVMLGLGPLDTQPYIHLIYWIFIGYISPLEGLLGGS